MHKSRIEAFSDGVIAIIITVMVLELKVPQGANLSDLVPLTSIGLCYLLSFVYLAIYWNNHHHLFQTVNQVNGAILWANVHLLFWLSLIPFVTAWAGGLHFANIPTAIYGFVLMMAGGAYFILTKTLVAKHGKDSLLAKAIGKDLKGKVSVILYALSIPMAFWFPIVAFLVYILVAVIWIIPDRRIEKEFRHRVNKE
jgi:uncharacterized membrane protein